MTAAPASRLAVVGTGWAGLTAAVQAVSDGWSVTLFDMSGDPGGRARTVEVDGRVCDNGQHILVGAYSATLAQMRRVGVDPAVVLMRCPLTLVEPDGKGLRLRAGHPITSFAAAVLSHPRWTLAVRLGVLRRAATWALRGFEAGPHRTVADLCRGWPEAALRELIEPLCVAALNTPAQEASAVVFLRVLRDALFSGPGASDLLLPSAPLGELFPAKALQWLQQHGAQWRPRQRVTRLEASTGAWTVDGEAFDAVVLACPAPEAARLASPHAPEWAQVAGQLQYEPIVTVLLDCPGATLASPMVSLTNGPAQFAFDLGRVAHQPGVFSFVVSGAREWVEAGRQATAEAVQAQALAAFPMGTWPCAPRVAAVLAEKRATFRCTAGLERPPSRVASGLWAAGDYVAGPYPATLEGAVRAGLQAAQGVSAECRHANEAFAMQNTAKPPA